ncbi:UNVERIFIED_ORG: aspartate racemase [Burkholderia sp. 1595]
MDCSQNVGVVVSRLNDPWVRRLSDATTSIDKARRQRLLFERVSVKSSHVEPVASWCALALLDAILGLARRGAEVVFLPPGVAAQTVSALSDATTLPLIVSAEDSASIERQLDACFCKPLPPFKIGVVGGVGPAATVDFLAKLVASTPATRDQEHIKVVVEQNPQIPDRTAHLLGLSDADPSVAIYAACLSVLRCGASIIVMPCNTAHAYVEQLQARLRIRIVNMLDETISHIVHQYGRDIPVGLLATSGTIESAVYAKAAAKQGLTLIAPDSTHQARVMRAIYGERGIKAGFVAGDCWDDLLSAVLFLERAGAAVLILGCTELPLLLKHNPQFPIGNGHVALVDPTLVLAQRCVELAAKSA